MKKKRSTPGRKKTAPKRSVLIIDDHIVVRQGLRHFINQEEDFAVCGEAEDARKGLGAISGLKPDIVLVDISMPGMNGVEFIKNARACHPELPIVVLSMHDESLYAERVLRAGALGYVRKDAPSEEVIIALRKALQGQFHTSGKVNMDMMQRFLGRRDEKDVSSISILSDRELEVFELIGQGISSRAIAGALQLSIKTVDSHRMHIKEKLKIRTATELVQRAVLYVENENPGRAV